MISVAEALALVEAQAFSLGTASVPLAQAAGRVLAEAVFADRDFPPFDRVMMDGIAIRFSAFASGQRSFRVESIQAAGAPQQALQDAAACFEVMTGAVLPLHTDAVIPYEDCELEDGVAVVQVDAVRLLQHVHCAGTDGWCGDLLLEPGQRLSPAAIGILASVGKSDVAVRALPRVAICATGDELVDVDDVPLPHQIRRSNSAMLAAALAAEGIVADAYHLPDDAASMQAALRELLHYDVLLLSGAVSKGKYDFLPGVLDALGMQTLFHRIAQKPGKPLLFGRFASGPVVFGFPGNPASTLVCYAVYFQAWLHRSLGLQRPIVQARLSEAVDFAPALSYHLSVLLSMLEGVLLATPCPAANSGDMPGLQRADAVLTLPASRARFEAGEAFPVTVLAPFF